MTPRKNSTEIQGIETATLHQEQFNIANQKLFSQFGFDEMKSSLDSLILGWLGSELNFDTPHERAKTFDFFNKSLMLFQIIDKDFYTKEKKEIPIKIFNQIFDNNPDYKSVKKYFNNTMTAFLDSQIANNHLIRNEVYFRTEEIQKYFKRMLKINKKTVENIN